jgi:hypothetical protein
MKGTRDTYPLAYSPDPFIRDYLWHTTLSKFHDAWLKWSATRRGCDTASGRHRTIAQYEHDMLMAFQYVAAIQDRAVMFWAHGHLKFLYLQALYPADVVRVVLRYCIADECASARRKMPRVTHRCENTPCAVKMPELIQ